MSAGQGAPIAERLLAFATLGLCAAAANTLLAGRVMAPVGRPSRSR